MTELVHIEDPTIIRNYLVWLRPSDGEDWGTLCDDVLPTKTFRPNLLCVIVTESNGQFHGGWSQAREQHEFHRDGADPYVRCDGTAERFHSRPDWWWDAEHEAVRLVREAAASS